jgi:hypothetical protein
VGQYDEEGGESATDLNADNSPGLCFQRRLQGAASVALLYQRVGPAADLTGDRENLPGGDVAGVT